MAVRWINYRLYAQSSSVSGVGRFMAYSRICGAKRRREYPFIYGRGTFGNRTPVRGQKYSHGFPIHFVLFQAQAITQRTKY